MKRAGELYREGRLNDAIQCLQAYLRDRPSDASSRVFLFELLCFAGELERARRQLKALNSEAVEYQNLVRLYCAALEADQIRQEAVAAPASPEDCAPLAGSINGRPFLSLTDADDHLGPRLEFIGGAEFHRIPFRYLARIEISPPARLRDLYFLPARVDGAAELNYFSFEQVLIPCLYAGSSQHDDELLSLGRTTEWFQHANGTVQPAGLRVLLADGEEIPVTDVRVIEFAPGSVKPDGKGE